MSGQEYEAREQRSKIKVVRNAKGDPQWEVVVLAGETDADLERMRLQALAQHRALERELAS